MNIVRVDGRFSLRDKLGAGSYATVYCAVDIVDNQEFAVKIEPCTHDRSSLEHEFQVLKNLQGGIGFPEPIWFSRESSYYALVLRNIGTSVQHLLVLRGGKLNLSEVLDLGIQMVSHLEHVHLHNYIHHDVKPLNILSEGASNIFLIDFGIAKQYRNPGTRAHIPFAQNCSFVGTPAFASINQHLGYESARRDDLESLAYVLIYLLCGSLPWFGREKGSLQDDEILRLKQDVPIDTLCMGVPREISTFLQHTRSLPFSSKPDYGLLRMLLQSCAVPTPTLPPLDPGKGSVKGRAKGGRRSAANSGKVRKHQESSGRTMKLRSAEK